MTLTNKDRSVLRFAPTEGESIVHEFFTKIDAFIAAVKNKAADVTEQAAEVSEALAAWFRAQSQNLREACDPQECQKRIDALHTVGTKEGVGANGAWVQLVVSIFLAILEELRKRSVQPA